MPGRPDWRALARAEFPSAARLVYLDRANPLFLCRRAMDAAQRYFADALDEPHEAPARWRPVVERIRDRYADALGAHAEEIVFLGDIRSVAPVLSAAPVSAPVRVVDASAWFGMRPIAANAVPADALVVAAHGVSIVRLPHAALTSPGRGVLDTAAPDYAAILAMGGALDVATEIGIDVIAARVAQLGATLRDRLQAGGLEILSHHDRTTVIRASRAEDVVARLRASGIIASAEGAGVGISVHLFTREEDVDGCVRALVRLAAGDDLDPVVAPGGPLVCVDLNGVLDAYQGWRGEEHWDPPAAGAREFLMGLRARGCRVTLFTTRYYRDAWRWLESHGLGELVDEVTDRKPAADVFVDDHAIAFRGDYEHALRQVDRFTPHWQKN